MSMTLQKVITKCSSRVQQIRHPGISFFHGFASSPDHRKNMFTDFGTASVLSEMIQPLDQFDRNRSRAITLIQSFTLATNIADLRRKALIGRIRKMDRHLNQKIGSPALTDQTEAVHIGGFKSWSAENIGRAAF